MQGLPAQRWAGGGGARHLADLPEGLPHCICCTVLGSEHKAESSFDGRPGNIVTLRRFASLRLVFETTEQIGVAVGELTDAVWTLRAMASVLSSGFEAPLSVDAGPPSARRGPPQR